MTPGDFLGFIFAAFMLYTPIKRLSRVNANIQQASAAAQRIFEILDTHSEVKERPEARPLAAVRAAIEFRHVGFAYEDGPNKPILRDVSFTARPARWSRSSASAAPARRRSSTCCRGSTTSPTARSSSTGRTSGMSR